MINRVKRILSLGRLTIIDGLRRHAIIGLILFALAGEAAGLLFFDMIPRDIGRASNDYLFSIGWVTGMIFLLFHGVKAVAWDSEHRVVHCFLARPISRTEYILGVFWGLAVLLLFLNLILGTIGWAVLAIIKNSVDPFFFKHLSLWFYILACLGLYSIQLMILSMILFFSGAIRGNLPVLLLTLCYYFICNGLPVVREAVSQRADADASQGLMVALKWLTTVFPDFSRLDFKTFVIAKDAGFQALEIVKIFGMSAMYIVIFLWFAALLFSRRDLS